MSPFRPYLHIARIAVGLLFWPVLAIVVWGELTAADNLKPLEGIWDKYLHFFSYSFLAGMAGASCKRRSTAAAATAGLIVLGAVLEVVQGLTGRDMSAYDELANALGAIVGGILARIVIEPLRKRAGAG